MKRLGAALLLLVLLGGIASAQSFKVPDQRALRFNKAGGGSGGPSYATVVNTSGTSITATCTATSGTHPSRDLVWQVLTGATTYTTPGASANCIDDDIIEAYFYQANNSNNAYQVGLAAGSGVTNVTPGLYATPSGTGSNSGYYIHFAFQYHATNTQWAMLGQDTNPYTAVSVPEGGTADTTLTAHGVLLGEGTSAVATTGPNATTGTLLTANGASSDPTFQAKPYDLGYSVSGTPSSQQKFPFICTRTLHFPASLAGSYPDANTQASCGTNPSTNPDIYLLNLNGSLECTLTLSTSCVLTVTTCTSAWTCSAGNTLTLVAPGATNAPTGVNVAITLAGHTP